MSTAGEIVRAAIPGASDALVDHILWGRTPFPCGPVTARDLYRAADRVRRAKQRGRDLCEFCDREAVPGEWACAVCDAALSRARHDG